jgi:putative ABC transport system permease protein
MGQTIVLQSLGNRARTVIGVAGDIRHVGLDTQPRFAVYYPTTEVIAGSMHVAWRSTDNPEVYVTSVRELAGRIDPTAIVDRFRSMDAVLAESVAPRRFNMQLIGSFAMIALLLASVGLFGVTAFLVSQRTREIGVRLALGATRAQIAYLVVRHGLTVALLGAAIGVGSASWLSGIMGRLLFAVSTTDTLTFIAVPGVVVLVTVAACYVPARRAANVSPVTALRGP